MDPRKVLVSLAVLYVAVTMISTFAAENPLYLVALAAIGGLAAVARAVWPG